MSKVISWKYYAGDKTTKESLVVYYAKDEETEKIVTEKGFFSLQYGVPSIPGISSSRKEGFTKKSTNHGKMFLDMKSTYPDLENKIKQKQSQFENYLDYYFINIGTWSIRNVLVHLFPLKEKRTLESLIEGNFFKKEIFINPDFIFAFERFITKELKQIVFQNKIKEILFEIKFKDSNFFEYLIETFEPLKILSKELTIVDKPAFLKTLKPGKVLLNNNLLFLQVNDVAEWTGEKLILSFSDRKDISRIEIYPEEDFVVKILEEQTFGTSSKLAI